MPRCDILKKLRDDLASGKSVTIPHEPQLSENEIYPAIHMVDSEAMMSRAMKPA